MLTKNLLHYYLECLKYESYFSIELKQNELSLSQINPEELDKALEYYEKISKHLKDDHTLMFGYPLLRKGQGEKATYLPLFLWSNSTFLSDCNLFKVDHLGFHQELIKPITDKSSIDTIHKLRNNLLHPLNPSWKMSRICKSCWTILNTI
ncbi:hypothetical protein DFP94_101922 [Fontibacillus phaseoli]|uniref:Uncharacterized protein n=1 Tax=Fontibacillus phaseoli TaxID=1416533 RepID=A0A369BQK6_9BACL|nr:hypothetical protein [Fontibacillus phaseoli]RCX23325.1 hypothetical protein DFP94_101922 [Fontibacillus phaseoli]